MKFINRNPWFVAILYAIIVAAFSALFYFSPDQWERRLGFIDSLYLSVSVITTLGYVRVEPAGDWGTAFILIEALLGVLLIGIFLNAISHWYSERENKAAKEREALRWRPAQLHVAQHLYRLHHMLFNSCRWILKHDHHIDLSRPDVPGGISQRKADGVIKKQSFYSYLEYHYNELNKMIERNAVALGSELHPMIMDYSICAKDMISACDFAITAYIGEGKYRGSYNHDAAIRMSEIFEEINEAFPELKYIEENSTKELLAPDDLRSIVEQSNECCEFLHMEISSRADADTGKSD